MKEKNCSLVAKNVGGQAIIEGVMMRGKSMYALAVRNVVTKEIIIEKENTKDIKEKFKLLKLPFLRGIASFFDSLVLGMKIIMRSASLSGLENENERENKPKSKIDIWLENKFGEKLAEYVIYFSVFISMLLSIAIFIALPVWISSFFSNNFALKPWAISILEGIIKMLIFLTYLLIISKMKDVQRLFMYHGAEHKTITCLEKGDDLTIENVKKHSRLHKRCGTSFLILVMIISIIVFMFLNTTNVPLRILSKIILVPFIAGISYEIIKLAGKYDNFFVKLISAPGIALQKITTSEPTDDMIEVAIKSLKTVLENDEKLKDENLIDDGDINA